MGGHSDSLIINKRIIFMDLLINLGLMSTYNTSRKCMVFKIIIIRMTRMFIFRSLDSSGRHHARTHHNLNKNRSDNLDIDIGQWGLDPLWRSLFSRGTVARMRDI